MEKNRAQINNGLKLQRKCVQVGRCPVCTLKPPCKHRNQVDPTVNPDLIGVSPSKVKRGMSISVAGDPNSDHSADRKNYPFARQLASRDRGLNSSIDSDGQRHTASKKVRKIIDSADHRAMPLEPPTGQKRNPYSILALGSPAEILAEKSQLETMMGSRTTRANVMAQLHVKKKFEATLEAGRI